jgi:uncharacterized protein with PIN domain/sulfur carrier protein ThiS
MGGDARATVVLHGDLVDFLPATRRCYSPGALPAAPAVLERTFDGRPAVKDVLEALGVPHPEVAALEVNGEPAGLDRRLDDGDRVEAWPADEAGRLDLPPAVPPAPEDAADPRFVLDGHLGRLAAYLRMLGFDTWYERAADDERLAAVAVAERRILLSRDRGLLKRSVVRRGAFVRSDRPVEQLVEVARRFGLVDRWRPFGRCLRCNRELVAASREEVLDRLQPLTRLYYDDFRRCPRCDAVYWKGSHHARMARLVERVRASAAAGGDAPADGSLR